MKPISPETFINLWKEFVAKKDDEIINAYSSNPQLTQTILGAKGSKTTGCPLGDYLKKNIELKSYAYRTEDGGVDLSVYEEKNIEGVKDMYEMGNPLDFEILKHYPRNYAILLEHENQIELAYQEMHKLSYLKAPLKVLITYVWETKKTGEDYSFVYERLRENFAQILTAANASHPENPDTRYLTIAGQKRDGMIYWSYLVQDPIGRTLKTENWP